MTHYLRWPIGELPSQVGSDDESGARIGRNVEGFLSFGPYCRLEPGTYFAGFHIRALEKNDGPDVLQISVRRRQGEDPLADRSVAGQELFSGVAGLVGVGFMLDEVSQDVEIRLFSSKAAAVEVRSLVVFRNEGP